MIRETIIIKMFRIKKNQNDKKWKTKYDYI